MHKHEEQTSETHGFKYSIPGAIEDRRAHGGVMIVQTCACGAVRKINSNGRYDETGPWVEAKPK